MTRIVHAVAYVLLSAALLAPTLLSGAALGATYGATRGAALVAQARRDRLGRPRRPGSLDSFPAFRTGLTLLGAATATVVVVLYSLQEGLL